MKLQTQGRGTNPASRANLKANAGRKWWVYVRTENDWSPFFGPCSHKEAGRAMDRLEALNRTGTQMYAVSTKN